MNCVFCGFTVVGPVQQQTEPVCDECVTEYLEKNSDEEFTIDEDFDTYTYEDFTVNIGEFDVNLCY